MHDYRRSSPRVAASALCWEVIDDKETSALVVDFSSTGARVERPYIGGRIARQVPLQLEVPGIDEVMWARADLVFDTLVPTKLTSSPFGLVRRTGYRLALAAARDLRLLKEFVFERDRASDRARAADRALHVDDALQFASCYR